jgi:hypothetical protein
VTEGGKLAEAMHQAAAFDGPAVVEGMTDADLV